MKEDREPKVGCGFCDRGFIHEGSGSFVRCHHCNPEQFAALKPTMVEAISKKDGKPCAFRPHNKVGRPTNKAKSMSMWKKFIGG